MSRRIEHALVCGDIQMRDDPRRARSLSLIAVKVLAVIIVTACIVSSTLFNSSGALGSAPIVMMRDYNRSSTSDFSPPPFILCSIFASARLIGGTGEPGSRRTQQQ